MAIAIHRATTTGRTLTLTVCSNWVDGACRCTDPQCHRVFQFGTDQAQEVSAREALLIVTAEQAVTSASVPVLVGQTL